MLVPALLWAFIGALLCAGGFIRQVIHPAAKGVELCCILTHAAWQQPGGQVKRAAGAGQDRTGL